MRVTVCELPEKKELFPKQWDLLIQHITEEKSELLLLPELIFGDWIASSKEVTQAVKETNVADHETWIERIEKINDKYVLYSKPVIRGNKFHNTAFVWHSDHGHSKIHSKSYFPEEAQFWEETVYDKDDGRFEILVIDDLRIGVLLCTEMWFMQHARSYGKLGIDLLLCPRATGISSVDQWVRCGQTLAVISGAFCLSSNRSGIGNDRFNWGGTGWIAEPMTGELVSKTAVDTPFKTVEIDLYKSTEAQEDYPLNVKG